MADIMIDIETLGRRNDTAIVEIGAVAFNPEDNKYISSFHIVISKDHWLDHNRTATMETLMWWITNNHQNISNILKGISTYEEALDSLSDFINEYKSDNTRIWTKGPMDLFALKDLYEVLNKSIPWEFWQPRDIRTLSDIPGWEKISTKKNTHNALEDAINQVEELQMNIAKLIKNRPSTEVQG